MRACFEYLRPSAESKEFLMFQAAGVTAKENVLFHNRYVNRHKLER